MPYRFHIFQEGPASADAGVKNYVAMERDKDSPSYKRFANFGGLEKLAADVGSFARYDGSEVQISFIPLYAFIKNRKGEDLRTEALSTQYEQKFIELFQQAYNNITEQDIERQRERVIRNLL